MGQGLSLFFVRGTLANQSMMEEFKTPRAAKRSPEHPTKIRHLGSNHIIIRAPLFGFVTLSGNPELKMG